MMAATPRETRNIYAYPEGTPGSDSSRGGYFGRLDEPQLAALGRLKAFCIQNNIDVNQLNPYSLHQTLTLLRYLRANQFDTAKASVHLTKNLAWRRENHVEELVSMDPADILGCSLSRVTELFPHWHCGYDKTGRPVLYKQYARFDCAQLKNLTPLESLVRYHVWEQEQCMKLCLLQSHRIQRCVETITLVLDLEGMRLAQVTSDFVSVVKALAQIDQGQYPETLGRLFIINAPSMFPVAWRMVRGFLDPAVVAKISIYGGRREWEPVLTDFIGRENIPATYGGELEALSPSMHPYAESMARLEEPGSPGLGRSRSKKLRISKQDRMKVRECYSSKDRRGNESPRLKSYKLRPPHGVDPVEGDDSSVVHNPGSSSKDNRQIYPYPAGTPGSDLGKGYYGNLDALQLTALDRLKVYCVHNSIDLTQLNPYSLHQTLTLLRYLRANQFDTAKASVHLTKNLAWRRENHVEELVSMDPADILGCSLSRVTELFPHWHCGYDKTGRPVLYKQYARFDCAQLKNLTPLESLVRYHVWEQEQCMKLCLLQSHRIQRCVETITLVLDLEGMRLAQVTSDFVSVVKALAQIDQGQYPETLGRLFIINAPSMFPVAWRMVRGFLDPAVVAKISIYGGRREWEPVLTDFIGRENIPATYGGELEALSPSMHPYAESMARLEEPLPTREKIKKIRQFSMFEKTSHPEDVESSKDEYKQTSFKLQMPNSDLDDDEAQLNENQQQPNDNDHNDPKPKKWLRLEMLRGAVINAFGNNYSNPNTGDHAQYPSPHAAVEKEIEILNTIHSQPKSQLQNNQNVIFEDYHPSLFNRIKSLTTRWIFSMTITQIKFYLITSLFAYTACALAAMIVAAFIMGSSLWSNNAAKTQLWIGVVVLLVCSVIVLINFAGFLGVYYQNRALLHMYGGCIVVGALLYLVISIACFLYAYVPSITKLGDTVLLSSIQNPSDRESAKKKLIYDNTALGSATLVASILSILPTTLTLVLNHRLRKIQGTRPQPSQLRMVLKVAQIVSLIASLVMLCYGGASIGYLLDIHFGSMLFPVYGLLYGGVTVLLSSIIGLWVAKTSHQSVIHVYYLYVLPFVVMIMVITASVSFVSIPESDQLVNRFVQDLSPDVDVSKLTLLVQTELLVTGVLSCFVCVFQFVSFYTARTLRNVMTGLGKGHSYRQDSNSSALLHGDDFLRARLHHSKRDKYLIFWALTSSVIDIYLHGTFAIFSTYTSLREYESSSRWLSSLWLFVGYYDRRYVSADSYLVVSCGFACLFVGPLLILYAWATFVKAPFRHILGILGSEIQILLNLLFLGIEMHKNFKDYNTKDGVGFGFLLTCFIIIGVIIPGVVFYGEFCHATFDAVKADNHSLLMHIAAQDSFDCDNSDCLSDSEENSGSDNTPIEVGNVNFDDNSDANYHVDYDYGYDGDGNKLVFSDATLGDEKDAELQANLALQNLSDINVLRRRGSERGGSVYSFQTAREPGSSIIGKISELEHSVNGDNTPGIDIQRRFSSSSAVSRTQGIFSSLQNTSNGDLRDGKMRRRSEALLTLKNMSPDTLEALAALSMVNKKAACDSLAMVV